MTIFDIAGVTCPAGWTGWAIIDGWVGGVYVSMQRKRTFGAVPSAPCVQFFDNSNGSKPPLFSGIASDRSTIKSSHAVALNIVEHIANVVCHVGSGTVCGHLAGFCGPGWCITTAPAKWRGHMVGDQWLSPGGEHHWLVTNGSRQVASAIGCKAMALARWREPLAIRAMALARWRAPLAIRQWLSPGGERQIHALSMLDRIPHRCCFDFFTADVATVACQGITGKHLEYGSTAPSGPIHRARPPHPGRFTAPYA